MANEERLAKLRSVYKTTDTFKSPAGKVYRYPVWYGYYAEDGKRKSVYLGRELPERFKCLIKKREYSRDPANYYWPGRGNRAKSIESQVNQVNGN
jgi:hypothetical protein